MRFGIAKLENKFSFVSPLTFSYICRLLCTVMQAAASFRYTPQNLTYYPNETPSRLAYRIVRLWSILWPNNSPLHQRPRNGCKNRIGHRVCKCDHRRLSESYNRLDNRFRRRIFLLGPNHRRLLFDHPADGIPTLHERTDRFSKRNPNRHRNRSPRTDREPASGSDGRRQSQRYHL